MALAGCSQPLPVTESRPPAPVAVDAIADLVPRAVARDGVLTIGTDPSYPPMEFIGRDGALEGADIDLATAVADTLGLTPGFEEDAFTALPDAVRTGQVEIAVSSLTVPANKPLRTDAVRYFRSGNQLVAHSSAPRLRRGQLCGRTVATVEGSTQVRTLIRLSTRCESQGSADIRIEALSDQQQVTRAAVTGRVDGLLSDTPVARFAVGAHPQALVLAGRPFEPAPFGMLTPPASARMAKALRRAVQHLIDTGSYEAILRRWGIHQGGVDRATIRWSDEPNPSKREQRQRRRG